MSAGSRTPRCGHKAPLAWKSDRVGGSCGEPDEVCQQELIEYDADGEALLGPPRSEVPLLSLDNVVRRPILNVLVEDKAHTAEIVVISR